jgi:hypothetical protein
MTICGAIYSGAEPVFIGDPGSPPSWGELFQRASCFKDEKCLGAPGHVGDHWSTTTLTGRVQKIQWAGITYAHQELHFKNSPKCDLHNDPPEGEGGPADNKTIKFRIGDIVRPAKKRAPADLVGVVTHVMSDSGVVANPYSGEWSNGNHFQGQAAVDLTLVLRPGYPGAGRTLSQIEEDGFVRVPGKSWSLDDEKVKRVPVDYDYAAIHPEFWKGLARIAAYAAQKYGSWDQYLAARLEGEKAPLNHALEHIRLYSMGVPHDHFGDLKMQLCAAAYNLMIELAYLQKFGHAPSPFSRGREK